LSLTPLELPTKGGEDSAELVVADATAATAAEAETEAEEEEAEEEAETEPEAEGCPTISSSLVRSTIS
jgi:hypothetical protein